MSADIEILSLFKTPLWVPCKVLEGKITISSSLVSNKIVGEFKTFLDLIKSFFWTDKESKNPGINSLCLLWSKNDIFESSLFFFR